LAASLPNEAWDDNVDPVLIVGITVAGIMVAGSAMLLSIVYTLDNRRISKDDMNEPLN